MKEDNFISIGIICKKELYFKQIEELHSLLYDRYNYFEIILLNYEIDTKEYFNLLKELNNIRIIELSSYVDIEIAHSTLIENCIGDYCAIIDLSHDSLEDLEKMLEKAEGYDVVIGKREKKVQSFFESITSKLFYKTISLFTGIKINSMYSDFFVINRKVINFITKNEDRVKFLKLLKFNNGFSKYEYLYMPLGRKSNQRTFLENINFTDEKKIMNMMTVRYFLALGVAFIFYAGNIWMLNQLVELPFYVAVFIALFLSFIFNYFLYKNFVFI